MKYEALLALKFFLLTMLCGAVHTQPKCDYEDFVLKWNQMSQVAQEIESNWNDFASAANEYVHTVEANDQVKQLKRQQLDQLWVKKTDIDTRLGRTWERVRTHSCF